MALPPSLASRAGLPEEAMQQLNESVTPGALATLMPCLVCAHCHSMLLAGLAGCIICPAAPF